MIRTPSSVASIKYERWGNHLYFANQPEHPLKAEWLSRLKVAALYDSPCLMRVASEFQRRLVADV